jgi:hypothetical protein
MRTLWPGRLETGRQGRAGGVWRLVPILMVAVVAGCAQPGSQAVSVEAAATSTSWATVTIGPNDGDRTVNLRVGDRLVVELREGKQPSRLLSLWTLRLPPSTVLRRLDRDSTPTRVVFVADGPGVVRLVLIKRQGCYPPLRCPLADPSGQSERMHPPLPALAVAITVRVQ